MSQFSNVARSALVGGVLAVILAPAAAHPVSASPRPASSPGQDRELVTLVCNGFTSNICTDLERVAADGTLTPYTAPPAGAVLVVTDFTWKAAAVTSGQVAFATIHHKLTSPAHDVAFSTAVATTDNAAVNAAHFTSGLEFSDVPLVFVSHTPNVAILQGYLIATRAE
jgi:hypothetical protein